jgi:hypothetical protein
MGQYREMAARQRALAEAARQRARQAREDAAHAAFQDTAVALSVQAADEEWAADSHLQSAHRYDVLADQHGEPPG